MLTLVLSKVLSPLVMLKRTSRVEVCICKGGLLKHEPRSMSAICCGIVEPAGRCICRSSRNLEAKPDLYEGVYGGQAEVGSIVRGVLQLARTLHTRDRMCCLAAEQVCLAEQAQHLYSSSLSLRPLHECTQGHAACNVHKGQGLPYSFPY